MAPAVEVSGDVQLAQVVAPVIAEYLPALHAVHVDNPLIENRPAAQLVHAVEVVLAAY